MLDARLIIHCRFNDYFVARAGHDYVLFVHDKGASAERSVEPRPGTFGGLLETAVSTCGVGSGVESVERVGRGEKHKLWQNSQSKLPLSRNSRAVTQ